jgi:uncharacterized membrane protein YraQ (UPF0718 family)
MPANFVITGPVVVSSCYSCVGNLKVSYWRSSSSLILAVVLSIILCLLSSLENSAVESEFLKSVKTDRPFSCLAFCTHPRSLQNLAHGHTEPTTSTFR